MSTFCENKTTSNIHDGCSRGGKDILYPILFFAAIATVLKHWPFCSHIKRAGSGACQSSIKIQSSHKRQCTSERCLGFFFFLKPISKKDNLKDKRVSGWRSLYCSVSAPGHRMEKPVASAVVVSSFVCLLNCVLKWTHSDAMLGENGRGGGRGPPDMMRETLFTGRGS